MQHNSEKHSSINQFCLLLKLMFMITYFHSNDVMIILSRPEILSMAKERRWSTPGWREEKRSSRPLLQRLTDTVVCAVYILAGTLVFRYTGTKPAASCDDNVTRVKLCEECALSFGRTG